MKLPTEPRDLSHLYVIDRFKNGNVFYLWSVHDDEWVCMRTGNMKDILKKLEELTREMPNL